MSLLDRYILRNIAVPTLLGLFLVGFLAITVRISLYAREIPVDLLTVRDVSELALLFVPSLMSMVIPVTFLYGVLMAFGRLAQQGELTAIRSSGLSLKRVMAPVLAVSVLLSAACFFAQDALQPRALGRALDLIYRELPQRATLIMLSEGTMHEYEGWHVYFEKKDVAKATVWNIDLVQPGEDGPTVIHAGSASFAAKADVHELKLTDCYAMPPNGAIALLEEYTLTLPIPSPVPPRGARQASSVRELVKSEKALTEAYESIRKQSDPTDAREALRKERQELAERVSMPFAVIAVTLVGAPLGARAKRSGRSFSFALGFAIILVYYTVQIVMEPPTARSLETHILNAWIPNALLMLGGFALIWRVDRV